MAVATFVADREAPEHVFERLRVAVKLEEHPPAIDDELEYLGSKVDVLVAHELARMGVLVGRKLTDFLHPGDLAQGIFDFHLRRRGTPAAVRSLAGRLLDRDDVTNAAALGANLVERPVGDDAPARDDDGARARSLDLGEVVRREHDGTLSADLLEIVEKFGFLVGVEIARWLVQDQDRRVMNEGLCKADALPVAVREIADLLAEHLCKTAHFDDARGPPAELVGLEMPQVGREPQVLEHAHLEVQRRALREIAQALAHLQRLVEHVVAVDARAPPRRGDEAREDAHRRRLAGAIGAEKANDFTAFYLEVDLVERPERPEVLRQVVRVDHHIVGHSECSQQDYGDESATHHGRDPHVRRDRAKIWRLPTATPGRSRSSRQRLGFIPGGEARRILPTGMVLSTTGGRRETMRRAGLFPGDPGSYCVSQKPTAYDRLQTGAEEGQSDVLLHFLQVDCPVAA